MSNHLIMKDLDAIEIQTYQQNRPPCFFLDRISEVVPGGYAKGYKNFTYNEWFFPAHFKDEPNVPGFIQIETLTQLFIMTFLTYPENKGKKTGFVSVDHARFKRKIIPGERLDMTATLSSFRRGLAKGSVESFVGDQPACNITLMVTIPDIMTQFTPK